MAQDSTCDSCLDQNCCAKGQVCAGNAECLSLLNCIGDCGSDQTCLSNCASQHPDGTSDYGAFIECLSGSCSQACGISAPGQGDCCEAHPGVPGCGDETVKSCVCAKDAYCCTSEWDAQCVSQVTSFGCGSCGSTGTAICSSGISAMTADCGNCLSSSCCDPFTSCSKDTTCLDCVTGASTSGCDTNAAFLAAGQCLISYCSAPCGTGGGACEALLQCCSPAYYAQCDSLAQQGDESACMAALGTLCAL